MIILQGLESYIEVLNLILAVFVVLVGLQIYRLCRGDLKKSIGFLSLSILLFGVHEIVGSLEEFGIFEIDGLYAFTEMIFIVVLLIALFMFRNLFRGISKKR